MRRLLIATMPWLLLRGLMKDSYSSRALIGAMNLFVVSAPALANHGVGVENPVQEQTALNTASLKSIESSWLEVPAACKARGFNASPISLDQKEASTVARDVYATFGA